jgi:hypothetical protein
MRDFKGMKRQRNRGRGGGGGGKPQQHNANRAFDSNGPDGVKVRGAAQHIYEKYQQLARDAGSAGDRVLAENNLQHAEHYFRVLRAMQPQRPLSEIIGRDQFASGYDIDFEDEGQAVEETAEAEGDGGQERQQGERPWQADRQQGDRQQGDRQRDDRGQGEYRQRDDRDFRGRDDRGQDRSQDRGQGEYRQRDDRGQGGDYRPREDRPQAESRQRDDRPRDDRPRDDRPRDDRPRDFQGDRRERFQRDDRRFQNDRPQNDRAQNDRPQTDRQSGREFRAERGERPERDPLTVIEPQATPLTTAPSAPAPYEPREGERVLRGEDGAMSQAPAFLQAAQPAPRPETEAEPVAEKRPRRRRAPRSFEADGAPAAAEADEG